MAFPFDLLDLFLPEIANWMAGKSTSEKRRFRRAGVGLFLTGASLATGTCLFGSAAVWAFGSHGWAYFVAFLFAACGGGLLACTFVGGTARRDTK